MGFDNDSSQHWYYCHDNGEVEPRHDADLRRARKENLYPSITSVSKGVRANSGLLRWIKGEIVKATEANPRRPNEDDKSYRGRIDRISNQKKDTAATFGTALHKALEDWPTYPEDPTLAPWLDCYGAWHHANIAEKWVSEKRLADKRIGIAGTVDFIGMHKQGFPVVVDYKTKGVKDGVKPEFYDEWTEQLAFYAKTYQLEQGLPETPRIMSLIINSTKPAPPIERLWTVEEQEDAYGRFLATAWLWFSLKSYWPRGMWRIGDFA